MLSIPPMEEGTWGGAHLARIIGGSFHFPQNIHLKFISETPKLFLNQKKAVTEIALERPVGQSAHLQLAYVLFACTSVRSLHLNPLILVCSPSPASLFS